MKCPTCESDLDIKESRKLVDGDGNQFVRRRRVCKNGHTFITHEVFVAISPIPDTYRLQRDRKAYQKKWRLKAKRKKEKLKDAWLRKIQGKIG